jgi:mRNA interferase MazF
MQNFEPGQIVRVPFPYSGGNPRQHRPALVIASPVDGFLLWVLMITSAENRAWPGDVAIPDHLSCGLPAPSLIRTAKIATLELAKAERRGQVPDPILALVHQAVNRYLRGQTTSRL